MAYIVDDKNNNQFVGEGAIPQSSSGSSVVGNNVSTAGTGPGGAGAWTNIQSYLNANQGNNTTASALENTVGSKINDEQSNIDKSTGEAKSQADQAFNQYYQDPNSARKDQYTPEAEKTAQDFLSHQYQGPSSYSYGMNGDVQQYGQNLGANNFNALLNNVYDKAAGGQMSSGQRALQNQLDTNNDSVEGKRKELEGRYNALNNYWQNAVTGTNDYVSGKANQYNNDQNQYKSNLNDYAKEIQGRIDTETADWNNRYKDAYNDYVKNPYGGTSKLAPPSLDKYTMDDSLLRDSVGRILGTVPQQSQTDTMQPGDIKPLPSATQSAPLAAAAPVASGKKQSGHGGSYIGKV